MSAQPPAADQRLARTIVLLLAVTCGAAVANIYYVQPLLDAIGGDLGVSGGTAGLLVTFSQLGFVVGIAFVVPVGDLIERRGMIVVLLALSALSLAGCAAAGSFPVLAVALAATGAFSVVAHVVIPLASHLAAPEERGRVVGTVMSGLLTGILLARTVSGLIAAVGGWRLVFALAAGLMVVMALVLWRLLERVPPTERIGYRTALGSIVGLVRELPVLRQRMLLGAFHFAGFSVLWTSITFLLSGPPYEYGEGVIGLFGLAGLAGISVAPVAGWLTDRGHGRLAQTGFLALILASWGLLRLGGDSVAALLAGIVMLDLGVQGSQISNLSAVFPLRPQARSRINTPYMVATFIGGVSGSALGSLVYASAGWGAACALGAGIAAAALLFWLLTERRRTRGPGPQAVAPEPDFASSSS